MVGLGFAVEYVLRRTRYGAAIECIAEDPGAARIIGLPVRQLTTATWAVGGATASLAGLLYIHLNSLDQISLTFVLISSLVAAGGGFLSIPFYTRVARAVTLAISQREFVLAAKAMGARHRRIVFREIMPNVILPVLALGLVSLGVIIVLEGTLAFLNLSVERPTATGGAMIAEGKRHLNDTHHVPLFPSLARFLTVLSINFVGDRLRSRFDVRESAL